jgi:hypothetical protein
MQTQVKSLGLTGNQLKILALIFMTADHIGYMLLPQLVFLRCIGRLAMPIFAWMIAEGCRYTKNRVRYFGMIFAVGLLCQIVYLVFMQSLYMCVLITFSMSVLLIFAIDYVLQKKKFLSILLLCAVLAGVCYVCLFLPGRLPGTDFYIDYGICGVILPVAIYIAKTKKQKLLAAVGVLILLVLSNGPIQWFALLALPLLAMYNGRRGKIKMKYLFYIYYPLHLAAIYGISRLLQ